MLRVMVWIRVRVRVRVRVRTRVRFRVRVRFRIRVRGAFCDLQLCILTCVSIQTVLGLGVG